MRSAKPHPPLGTEMPVTSFNGLVLAPHRPAGRPDEAYPGSQPKGGQGAGKQNTRALRPAACGRWSQEPDGALGQEVPIVSAKPLSADSIVHHDVRQACRRT